MAYSTRLKPPGLAKPALILTALFVLAVLIALSLGSVGLDTLRRALLS